MEQHLGNPFNNIDIVEFFANSTDIPASMNDAIAARLSPTAIHNVTSVS